VGDADDVDPTWEHRCGPGCAEPVRCIICRRIKRPVGAPVPEALSGMRCDEECVGYHLDPRPGHRWPAFVSERLGASDLELVDIGAARGRTASTPSPEPGGGDPLELLAWALHQAHPVQPRMQGL
jgi:hypothetical protein